MDIEHDWTLLPAVVVRGAGFAWELVLSLVYPRAAEAAVAVVRLERRALDLLADAPACGAGPLGKGRRRAGGCRAGCGGACVTCARCRPARRFPATGRRRGTR
ncbi:hypothetical protein ACFQYP_10930 [Nonomuraea antimicrobica]